MNFNFLKRLLIFLIRALNRCIFFCQTVLRQFHKVSNECLYRIKYQARPDDIFIVTYPKSGTTWVQMILYQLTSDGTVAIPHINTVIPNLEGSFMAEYRNLDRMKSSRIFNTHFNYQSIFKGRGRYIYILRDSMDVALSYYYHYRAYKRFKGSLEDFITLFLAGKVAYGLWSDHIQGWLENKDKLNVLILTYESLSADLDRSIRKIAKFCEIEVDENAFPRILHRCGFFFMKNHQNKFDLYHGKLHNLGLVSDRNFIRKGKVGEGASELDSEMREAFAGSFNSQLEKMGLHDYKA